jgi:hypothetical protein
MNRKEILEILQSGTIVSSVRTKVILDLMKTYSFKSARHVFAAKDSRTSDYDLPVGRYCTFTIPEAEKLNAFKHISNDVKNPEDYEYYGIYLEFEKLSESITPSMRRIKVPFFKCEEVQKSWAIKLTSKKFGL